MKRRYPKERKRQLRQICSGHTILVLAEKQLLLVCTLPRMHLPGPVPRKNPVIKGMFQQKWMVR